MFIQQGEWYSYYATLFFITVLPLTVMSIAAYVVLGENWEATCGGKMMPLQSQLLVYAITESFVVVLVVLLSFQRRHARVANSIVWIGIINQVFMFIWIIVGIVALARDSSDCKNEAMALWALSVAIFVLKPIAIICKCALCCGCICCETIFCRMGMNH